LFSVGAGELGVLASAPIPGGGVGSPAPSVGLGLLLARLALSAAEPSAQSLAGSAPRLAVANTSLLAGGVLHEAVGVVTLVVLEGLVLLEEVHGVRVSGDEEHQADEGEEGNEGDELLVHF